MFSAHTGGSPPTPRVIYIPTRGVYFNSTFKGLGVVFIRQHPFNGIYDDQGLVIDLDIDLVSDA